MAKYTPRYDRFDLRRFWAKVNKFDDCWEWRGNRIPKGYGRFFVDGRNIGAHVFSWVIHNGRPVPEGLMVCHACDNPPCVRPDHLYAGTHQQNMDDIKKRGRRKLKINDHQVAELRERYHHANSPAPSLKALAAEFGISYSYAKVIIKGDRR